MHWDEYSTAVKDLTCTVKEARALRKAHFFHHNGSHAPSSKGKEDGKEKSNTRAFSNGTTVLTRMGAVILLRLRCSRHWWCPTSPC
jgi:hypothetical protein